MQQITFTNPPFLEAVCIFQFSGEKEWNWTIPGLFFSKIEGQYVVAKNDSADDSEQETEFESELTRFIDKENRRLVNLGPHGMSINCLPPYSGWLAYKAEIERIVNCYCEIAAPDAIESISLRYINRFQLPEENCYYDEFLHIAPKLPEGKRDMAWLGWGQKVDIWLESLESIFSIKAGTQMFQRKGSEEELQRLMLDLEVERMMETPLSKAEVFNWLEGAHGEIKKTFLDSLTDLSKTTIGFEEVNNED